MSKTKSEAKPTHRDHETGELVVVYSKTKSYDRLTGRVVLSALIVSGYDKGKFTTVSPRTLGRV